MSVGAVAAKLQHAVVADRDPTCIDFQCWGFDVFKGAHATRPMFTSFGGSLRASGVDGVVAEESSV